MRQYAAPTAGRERARDGAIIANQLGGGYTPAGRTSLSKFATIFGLVIAVGAPLVGPCAVSAQGTATQITITQPAEATTMAPGRSTQVLTVNSFYKLYDTLSA
jgi:hypothetical protein